MSEDKFCLRWNDFEANIKTSFRDLRESKDLFDITLVCGEFYEVQAHKVILSASSPFFRDVLCRSKNNNPLVYLRGISKTDLQYILDFIYHGEVNVAQASLNNFLSVAEDLKIKGLTQSPTDSKQTSSHSDSKHSRAASSQQRSRTIAEDEDEIEEIPVAVGVKNEVAEDVVQDHSVAIDYGQAGYDGGDLMLGDYEDGGSYELQHYASPADKDVLMSLDAQITSMMFREEKMWHCSVCGKSSTSKTDISRHIEGTHITNHPGLECDVCGEKLKSRNALRQHRALKHRNVLEFGML